MQMRLRHYKALEFDIDGLFIVQGLFIDLPFLACEADNPACHALARSGVSRSPLHLTQPSATRLGAQTRRSTFHSSAAHQKYVRRLNLRIELHVILPPTPSVRRAAQ